MTEQQQAGDDDIDVELWEFGGEAALVYSSDKQDAIARLFPMMFDAEIIVSPPVFQKVFLKELKADIEDGKLHEDAVRYHTGILAAWETALTACREKLTAIPVIKDDDEGEDDASPQ